MFGCDLCDLNGMLAIRKMSADYIRTLWLHSLQTCWTTSALNIISFQMAPFNTKFNENFNQRRILQQKEYYLSSSDHEKIGLKKKIKSNQIKNR